MKSNYPVVFFVFKRPKTTYDFLTRMYQAGIKKIYVFADGPRDESEKDLTDRVKAEIIRFQKTHQDITLLTSFAKKNIGLRQNIITGLNKVFKHETAALIIEDDCEPTADFFRFTHEMLNRYKDDMRIMSINGISVGGDYSGFSYGFTKYSQCWGWATWKRAWDLYDPEMKDFNKVNWLKISRILKLSKVSNWYWYNILSLTKKKKISTWDYQWSFAHFWNNSLAIVPKENLVTNIGFDSAATNTKHVNKSISNINSKELIWPLTHPTVVTENIDISKLIEKNYYLSIIAILGLIRKIIL